MTTSELIAKCRKIIDSCYSSQKVRYARAGEKAPFKEGWPDGISCRDSTIHLQQCRIAELERALERLIYEATHLSPVDDCGRHFCKISAEALQQARVAYWQNPEGRKP